MPTISTLHASSPQIVSTRFLGGQHLGAAKGGGSAAGGAAKQFGAPSHSGPLLTTLGAACASEPGRLNTPRGGGGVDAGSGSSYLSQTGALAASLGVIGQNSATFQVFRDDEKLKHARAERVEGPTTAGSRTPRNA